MPHPTQTSLLASNVRYKCFRKHFHLVFVCVCQINGPLRNLQRHKADIRRHRCLQSAERVIISFIGLNIFLSPFFFKCLTLDRQKVGKYFMTRMIGIYFHRGLFCRIWWWAHSFQTGHTEPQPSKLSPHVGFVPICVTHMHQLIPPWCTWGARRRQPAQKAASG